MNWQEVQGNWKELKGRVRARWGRLTDDDVTEIAGRREALVGKLQQRYGKELEEVERAVSEWFDGLAEPATRDR